MLKIMPKGKDIVARPTVGKPDYVYLKGNLKGHLPLGKKIPMDLRKQQVNVISFSMESANQ